MSNPTLINGFEDVVTFIKQQEHRNSKLRQQLKKVEEQRDYGWYEVDSLTKENHELKEKVENLTEEIKNLKLKIETSFWENHQLRKDLVAK
jgi:peptidoglycan hydrolase CwlO-like protein